MDITDKLFDAIRHTLFCSVVASIAIGIVSHTAMAVVNEGIPDYVMTACPNEIEIVNTFIVQDEYACPINSVKDVKNSRF